MLRRTLTMMTLIMLTLGGTGSIIAGEKHCENCEKDGVGHAFWRGLWGHDCEDCANPPPKAGWGDGYPLGFGWGWTSKYYSVGRCPGHLQCRPCNPLFAVPLHSGIGQTGPRRILLWPPTVGSPLYNNTPVLVPYPQGQRPCHGVNCAY